MKNKNTVISEFQQMKNMLKTVHTLKEQTDPQYQNRLNSDPAVNQLNGDVKSQQYNIDGEHIVISSRSGQSIELTDDVRSIFEQSCDEFKQQVSDLVDFNTLQVNDNDVEWSGRLTKFDVEFFYYLGNDNGVYLKGDKIKVDEELTTLLGQLTQFYKIFSQKWSSVATSRQQGTQQNGI
jgi:hypothetical protein